MISYAPLAATLVRLEMSKTDLRTRANLSKDTAARLWKLENSSTDVLNRIMNVLHEVDPTVKITDVIEFVPDEVEESEERQQPSS